MKEWINLLLLPFRSDNVGISVKNLTTGFFIAVLPAVILIQLFSLWGIHISTCISLFLIATLFFAFLFSTGRLMQENERLREQINKQNNKQKK